jgi:hypothetical protein
MDLKFSDGGALGGDMFSAAEGVEVIILWKTELARARDSSPLKLKR